MALVDLAQSVRKKGRFVVELRYEAVPQFFDMRGRIIGDLHAVLRPELPWWRAADDQILFTNDLSRPRDQFIVGTRRTMFVLEDSSSLDGFVDRAEDLLARAHGYLGQWWPSLARLGVRFLEIVRSPYATHDATRNAILDTFHKVPFAIPLRITDTQSIIVHDRGRIGIGPTKRGDEWIAQVFQDAKSNVPDIGIALDVDSFVTTFEASTPEKLRSAFRNVLDLTMAVEVSALRAAKVLGVK